MLHLDGKKIKYSIGSKKRLRRTHNGARTVVFKKPPDSYKYMCAHNNGDSERVCQSSCDVT